MLLKLNAHWPCAEKLLIEVEKRWGNRQEIELTFNTAATVCFCDGRNGEPLPKVSSTSRLNEKYSENGSIFFSQGANSG